MNHRSAIPILLASATALLLLGTLLRVSDLAQNLYWVDEVHSTLRLAGHTKASATALLSQPTAVADLTPLQGAGPLPKTMAALAQHPEHPPLYYLLTWSWLALRQPEPNDFVAALRWPGLMAGLLVLPASYWFCRELWGGLGRASSQGAIGLRASDLDPRVATVSGLVALALITLSPLHVLYAQEAREYSLWTLLILVSGAMLLRALRRGGRHWAGYGLAVALGLYSHLLFTLVALGQGLYVLAVYPKQKRPCLTAIAVAFFVFTPWVGVGLWQRGQLAAVASAVQRQVPLGRFVDLWLRNLNRVFFNADWGTANLLVAALAAYSLYFLWRTHRRSAGLILLLVALPGLALLLTDVGLGGISSTRIRYLIPVYLGVQLTIAYTLAHKIALGKLWQRRAWGAVLALALLGSGSASWLAAQTPVSWVKSDKAVYYPAMAAAINASESPWVLSDGSATYLLALSQLLSPTTTLQMVDPNQLPPRPAEPVFLFAPSPQLKRAARQRYGRLDRQVEQNPRFQLLRVSAPGREASVNP